MTARLTSLAAAPLVLAALLLAALPAAAPAKTVWLCRPGLAANPCEPGLATTLFSPAGVQLGVEHPRRPRHRRIDCFYVYPTVSGQPRPAATRRIDPELRSIALYQAARYSRDCRVFAPVYRQITIQGLFGGGVTPAQAERAYRDVRAAWRTYLRRFNHGRGVVLIGHSQGTLQLRRLVREEIDPRRRARRRLVSALLLGGNVTVAAGRDRGGDFKHVRACRTARQLGCVVAFSTFGGPAPPDSVFGRTNDPGRAVLCTNPTALGGGTGIADTIVPAAPFAPGTAIGSQVATTGFTQPPATTPWISIPGSYSARCVDDGGAHVLAITPLDGAPQLAARPLPSWGLHLVDGNIALGNLARLVRRQAAEYAARL
jgi:Protein of unknown function (DUF3089)